MSKRAGWKREPARHSLAARGVRTGPRKSRPMPDRMSWGPSQKTQVRESIWRLEEIKDEMKELVDEAKNLIRSSTDDDILYERARRYWLAHIEGALDEDNEWMGGSMSTMEDTIGELREILKEAEHGPEEEE